MSLTFVAHADDVKGNFSKVGDATHLEFSGRKTWNYNVRREANKIIINIPNVDGQTRAHFTAWKDGLIDGVDITPGPDGGDEITFKVNPQVESFDYLTDQPARLVVDFYKNGPVESKVKVAAKKAPPKKVVKVAAPTRLPAAESKKDLPPVQNPKLNGAYDAADPDYERFNILEADIREDAIIASRNNIYLYYPIYEYPTPILAELIEAPPIYEIKPEDNDENKKARLLLTLFNKKRPAVFLKTLEFFQKQYPKSRYDELVRYMEADIYYGFYEESKNPLDLEKAVTRYTLLVDQFPESPLAERTMLFTAYSYFSRGNYLDAMKILSRFEKRFPNSKSLSQVRLSLADTHRATNHTDDALKVLDSVENDPGAGESSLVAAFKKGDVYFSLKDYGKAVGEYNRYLKKFSDQASKFPNAYFNLAESYFWLGQYKASMDTHREFVRNFPKDDYGGYSITRIGELMEIMGAPKKKVQGAYLEAMFRHQGTEGASVAKVRLMSDRMDMMKDKELKTAIEEVNHFGETSKLPRAQEFVTILVGDGYNKRKDYAAALDLLVNFYRANPTAELDIFRKRIRGNIIEQLRAKITKNEFLEVFKIYGEHVAVWLKNVDRIDLEYYLGRSFELAGVQSEASDYYRKVLNRLYAIQGTQEEKERRVLEDLPSAETVNLRLAAMTVAQKDFGKSSFYLESIKAPAKLSPQEQVERIELSAIVASERGQSEQAKKYLRDLIESWKGQPAFVSGSYLKLAELQMQDKEFDAAAVNLEKILHLDTDSKQVPPEAVARAMELRGDLLAQIKKNPDAIKAYRKLLDKYEDSQALEPVRYRLGKLLFEVGNFTEAEKTWSALKPESFWFKMAKEQLENSKWSQQYKKYLKRIPAMANSK